MKTLTLYASLGEHSNNTRDPINHGGRITTMIKYATDITDAGSMYGWSICLPVALIHADHGKSIGRMSRESWSRVSHFPEGANKFDVLVVHSDISKTIWFKRVANNLRITPFEGEK